MQSIRVGQKAEIYFRVSTADEIKLLCSVKDIYPDRVQLNFPKATLTFIDYLQEGVCVLMKIYTPKGIKIFNVLIIDSPDTGVFMVEFGEDYDELQRRKFIRASVETKMILRRAPKDPFIVKTLEISSGAVRFTSNESFKNREPFDVFLYLPNNIRSVKAYGIIVRAEHLQKNEHLLLITRIQDSDVLRINRKCSELNAENVLETV